METCDAGRGMAISAEFTRGNELPDISSFLIFSEGLSGYGKQVISKFILVKF